MIDLHCHLLPGIDDGAQNWEQCQALLVLMQQQGVQYLVCTPHVNPPAFANSKQSIDLCFAHYQQQFAQSKIQVAVAAECRLHADLPFAFERGELPLFTGAQGQASILLELPTRDYPVCSDMIIDWLLEQGVRPIIAHPERNLALQQQPAKVRELKRKGVWLQLTAGSLLGDFGPDALQASLRLLDNHQVELIASDSHNLAYRPPKMAEAKHWLSQHYGPALAEQLTKHNPWQICQGMFV